MPEHESVRSTAEAIGRITCIKTGEEIGYLYQWDSGGTQAALYRTIETTSPRNKSLQRAPRASIDQQESD